MLVWTESLSYHLSPFSNEDLSYVTGKISGFDAAEVETLAADGAFGDPHSHPRPSTPIAAE